MVNAIKAAGLGMMLIAPEVMEDANWISELSANGLMAMIIVLLFYVYRQDHQALLELLKEERQVLQNNTSAMVKMESSVDSLKDALERVR